MPGATPSIRKPFVVPDAAVKDQFEATITLDMIVEGDGSVSDVRVLEASHPGLLDQNAIRAARTWKYEAPVVDGVRVRRRTDPVTIHLFINHCPDLKPDLGDVLKMCGQVLN